MKDRNALVVELVEELARHNEPPKPGDLVCLRDRLTETIYDTENDAGIPVKCTDVMLVLAIESQQLIVETTPSYHNLFVYVNGGFGWIWNYMVLKVKSVRKPDAARRCHQVKTARLKGIL